MELGERGVGETGSREALPEPPRERLEVLTWIDRPQRGRPATGRRRDPGQQARLGLGRGQALVRPVEPAEEDATLAVREPLEERRPLGRARVPQHPRRGPGNPEGVVPDHVLHHPDEHEVDRTPEGLADRRVAVIVAPVEVVEVVQPPPGEEAGARGGGVAAGQGEIHQLPQGQGGILHQAVQAPAREPVRGIDLDRPERGPVAAPVGAVELGHDLQVRHERPELGRGAEVQLQAVVRVEGAVPGIDLDPEPVRVLPPLVEREGVDHARRVPPVEHAVGAQPGPGGPRWIRERAEPFGDRELGGEIQRRVDGQIEPVEVVEAVQLEEGHQRPPEHVGRVPIARAGRRRRSLLGEVEAKGQGRVAEGGRDEALRREEAEVAIRQLLEGGPVPEQVEGGAALGDEEGEHPAIGESLVGAGIHAERRLLQRPVGRIEVGAEERPQAGREADDLAPARDPGERHRVQVVDDDGPAGLQRPLPSSVGAKRCREHLAQLLGRRPGHATRGVPDLLELGGQGAPPRDLAIQPQLPESQLPGRPGQPVPLDGGVALRRPVGQELPVLEEEERLDDRRGDRIELRVHELRVARPVHERTLGVEDRQPGLVLLGPRGRDTPLRERGQDGREPDPRRGPVGRGQPVEEGGEPAVPEPVVVRPATGRDHPTPGRPGALVGRLPGEPGEDPGLEPRGPHLTHPGHDQPDEGQEPGEAGADAGAPGERDAGRRDTGRARDPIDRHARPEAGVRPVDVEAGRLEVDDRPLPGVLRDRNPDLGPEAPVVGSREVAERDGLVPEDEGGLLALAAPLVRWTGAVLLDAAGTPEVEHGEGAETIRPRIGIRRRAFRWSRSRPHPPSSRTRADRARTAAAGKSPARVRPVSSQVAGIRFPRAPSTSAGVFPRPRRVFGGPHRTLASRPGV